MATPKLPQPLVHVEIPEIPRSPMPADAPPQVIAWYEDHHSRLVLWREQLVNGIDQLARAVAEIYAAYSSASGDIVALENRVRDLEESLDEALDRISDLEYSQSGVVGDLSAVQAQLGNHQSTLDDHETRITNAEATLQDHEQRITAAGW